MEELTLEFSRGKVTKKVGGRKAGRNVKWGD